MGFPYIPPYQQYQQMMPNYQQPSGNGNIISVPSEAVARNYFLAPGTSGTFINENEPYCCTKTMGLCQFDRPVFKRYRLVEETDEPQDAQNTSTTSATTQSSTVIPDSVKADIDALRALYDDLKLDVEILKEDINNGKSADTTAI
jgi:hypothetical protein